MRLLGLPFSLLLVDLRLQPCSQAVHPIDVSKHPPEVKHDLLSRFIEPQANGTLLSPVLRLNFSLQPRANIRVRRGLTSRAFRGFQRARHLQAKNGEGNQQSRPLVLGNLKLPVETALDEPRPEEPVILHQVRQRIGHACLQKRVRLLNDGSEHLVLEELPLPHTPRHLGDARETRLEAVLRQDAELRAAHEALALLPERGGALAELRLQGPEPVPEVRRRELGLELLAHGDGLGSREPLAASGGRHHLHGGRFLLPLVFDQLP
mmetsp:Transcript_104081/g.324484  ORF Transcript_104081/g.324484 Transcript_104081/m.324484 type:complete len:264 (+) Transcript_104081:401-1192(+)